MVKSLLNTTGITWQVEENVVVLSDHLAFVATILPKIHSLDLKCTLNYIKERPKFLGAMLTRAQDQRLLLEESAAAMGKDLIFKVHVNCCYHGSQCDCLHDLLNEARQEKLLKDEQAAKSKWEYRKNHSILLLLSVMYGMVLGTMAAYPMLLIHFTVTYKQQVKFSIAYWPHALKLLWSPYINSLCTKWVCPRNRKPFITVMQYCISFLLLRITFTINKWLNCIEDLPTTADRYASLIFLLCLLAAALDICEDAWIWQCGGSKLAKYGRPLGIVCGFALGYTVLLLLGYNMFLQKVSLNRLFIESVWGLAVCLVILLLANCKEFPGDATSTSTALVLLQEQHDLAHQTVFAMLECYRIMLQIMHRSTFAQRTFTMITMRTSLYIIERMTALKKLRIVVFDDQSILYKLFLQPFQLSFPLCLRLLLGTDIEEPVHSYLNAIPSRISDATIIAAIIYTIPSFMLTNHTNSSCFHAMLLNNFVYYQLVMDCMYVLAGIIVSTVTSEWPCDVFYHVLRQFIYTNKTNYDPCGIYQTCNDYNIFNQTITGDMFSRSYFVDNYFVEFFTCLGFVLIWFYLFRSSHGSLRLRY